MHVINGAGQIISGIGDISLSVVNQQRAVATAEQVAPEPVSPVESTGVGVLHPSHPLHKIGLGCAEDRMVVIVHQRPGKHLPSSPQACFAKCLYEQLSVLVVPDNVLPSVSSCHDMINGSLELQSRCAWHDAVEPKRLSIDVNC